MCNAIKFQVLSRPYNVFESHRNFWADFAGTQDPTFSHSPNRKGLHWWTGFLVKNDLILGSRYYMGYRAG